MFKRSLLPSSSRQNSSISLCVVKHHKTEVCSHQCESRKFRFFLLHLALVLGSIIALPFYWVSNSCRYRNETKIQTVVLNSLSCLQCESKLTDKLIKYNKITNRNQILADDDNDDDNNVTLIILIKSFFRFHMLDH
jgi:hypothetical protein